MYPDILPCLPCLYLLPLLHLFTYITLPSLGMRGEVREEQGGRREGIGEEEEEVK